MKITMKWWSIALIMVMASCDKNNTLEREHPYDANDPDHHREDLFPGLANLGGTCFANASINVMLASSEFTKFLSETLPKIVGQDQAQYDLRVKLQTSLKSLNDARQKKQKDLTHELNAYFDAFEAARKSINHDERVGNKDKLRQEQGDARDFVEDNLSLLGYSKDQPMTFAYNVFTDDKSRKIFALDDVVIGLPISKLAPDKEHSFQDAYSEWLKPTFMDFPNQLEKTPGNKVDSNRYDVLAEPAAPALFLATLRFIYDLTGKPSKKLSTMIKPTMELNVNTKTKAIADLALDHPHTYYLKAIAIHHGSLNGGHYYAYVYNYPKKRWEKYNDTQASVATEVEVVKDSAENGYIYLYELQP